MRGGTQRGSREDEDARRKDRREGAIATDRGPQRAHRVLPAGALEPFVVDPQSTIYKQATGALEALSAAALMTYK
ncbi:hypothetical protein DVK07_04385 [Halorubrum sp. Atlit-26R]|nr:hypothetical protein DVK07_04385 [Halorubrum sp. Atlit-26R]